MRPCRRLPRRCRRSPLRHGLRFIRHRLLYPPKQLRIPERGGVLPRQLLDLLHDPLYDPLAGATQSRTADQRFRLAAGKTRVENGNADVAQSPADEPPEVTSDLFAVIVVARLRSGRQVTGGGNPWPPLTPSLPHLGGQRRELPSEGRASPFERQEGGGNPGKIAGERSICPSKLNRCNQPSSRAGGTLSFL